MVGAGLYRCCCRTSVYPEKKLYFCVCLLILLLKVFRQKIALPNTDWQSYRSTSSNGEGDEGEKTKEKEATMALAQQCKFFGHIITVDKALAIREAAAPEHKGSLHFECMKCGRPVRPRIAGDKWVAHFVHLAQSPECHFTEPPRLY